MPSAQQSSRSDAASKAATGQGTLPEAVADPVIELRHQAVESAQQIARTGIETAAHRIRTASDEIARAFGMSGEEGERLNRQARQNAEALARCGALLTEAAQDGARNLFDLGLRQTQRNLDGLNRLAEAKSLQEFTTILSDLVREAAQQMVQDGRTLAEASLRAADEAGKTLSRMPRLPAA
ncbi:phasin family protein [Methylobacterium nigriterrae]|uniref:phasin family protein n=1 Tax=Methylobacterium nigriterrae TaxID=3127512 RepID=UPI0030134374